MVTGIEDENICACSFLEAVHSNSLRLVQLHLAVPQALQARDLQQALFVATRLGHEAVVRLLLETGLSLVLAVDGRQNTPLYVAVAHRWPRLTELLARAGPPDLVNAWVGARHAAVHLAAQEGLDECLHVLVECGADLRARDSAGCTPLILAVRYKRYGVMKVGPAALPTDPSLDTSLGKGWAFLTRYIFKYVARQFLFNLNDI